MTTRPCVHCWAPIPLTGGLLCPGCVEFKKLVAAADTRNCPESHRHALQARRLLAKHRRWVKEGHVPEFAREA